MAKEKELNLMVDPIHHPHSSLDYLAPAMFAALLLGKLPTPELQTR